MNKTQEALKMAIETLELLNEHVYRTGKAYDAIKLCKEALAQEQEFFKRGKEIAKWADEQNRQKQEPVGYISTLPVVTPQAIRSDANDVFKIPLYEHPAKQLSDDEIEEIANKVKTDSLMTNKPTWHLRFARAIEAKIRGKS